MYHRHNGEDFSIEHLITLYHQLKQIKRHNYPVKGLTSRLKKVDMTGGLSYIEIFPSKKEPV